MNDAFRPFGIQPFLGLLRYFIQEVYNLFEPVCRDFFSTDERFQRFQPHNKVLGNVDVALGGHGISRLPQGGDLFFYKDRGVFYNPRPCQFGRLDVGTKQTVKRFFNLFQPGD